MNTNDAILGMTKQIVRKFKPSWIILFGSQARGAENANSDIDLLVVLPEVTDKRKIAIEIRRSLSEFNIPKDILVSTPAEISKRGHLIGTLLHTALSEGKKIYERP
jgi:predicted nucleotidyltransferase